MLTAMKPNSGDARMRSAFGKMKAERPDTPDDQFGRRVEVDRSWTIYHVFTGVPARVDGMAMTDLSQAAATDGMLSLNLCNVERRKQRGDGARQMANRIGPFEGHLEKELQRGDGLTDARRTRSGPLPSAIDTGEHPRSRRCAAIGQEKTRSA